MAYLHAIVPVKNEADRYLESVLMHLNMIVDSIFVFDDQSVDASPKLALDTIRRGAVYMRNDDEPSFVEHEGKFRQCMWERFEEVIEPDLDDWVLANDADEYLTTSNVFTPSNIVRFCDDLHLDISGVEMPFKEVFGFRDKRPLVRTDRQWGNIRGLRLFPYQDGGAFRQVPMACGSAPTYALDRVFRTDQLYFLHYGYARKEDRAWKYQRYKDRIGHSNLHVESILRSSTLEPHYGWYPGV